MLKILSCVAVCTMFYVACCHDTLLQIFAHKILESFDKIGHNAKEFIGLLLRQVSVENCCNVGRKILWESLPWRGYHQLFQGSREQQNRFWKDRWSRGKLVGKPHRLQIEEWCQVWSLFHHGCWLVFQLFSLVDQKLRWSASTFVHVRRVYTNSL